MLIVFVIVFAREKNERRKYNVIKPFVTRRRDERHDISFRVRNDVMTKI